MVFRECKRTDSISITQRNIKAVVTSAILLRFDYDSINIRLPFDCNSTELRPYDDPRHDRKPTCSCRSKWKKRSKRRKHCALAVVRWSQKNRPPQTPFPGGGAQDGQNLISWIRSLPLPTDRLPCRSLGCLSQLLLWQMLLEWNV